MGVFYTSHNSAINHPKRNSEGCTPVIGRTRNVELEEKVRAERKRIANEWFSHLYGNDEDIHSRMAQVDYMASHYTEVIPRWFSLMHSAVEEVAN